LASGFERSLKEKEGMKKAIKDIDSHGKRGLVRANLNVRLEDGRISDDSRVRACLP
jgi:phosphoglycerate kinase